MEIYCDLFYFILFYWLNIVISISHTYEKSLQYPTCTILIKNCFQSTKVGPSTLSKINFFSNVG